MIFRGSDGTLHPGPRTEPRLGHSSLCSVLLLAGGVLLDEGSGFRLLSLRFGA